MKIAQFRFDLVFTYTGGFTCTLAWDEESQVVSGGIPVENITYIDGNVIQESNGGTVTLASEEAPPGSLINLPLNFSGDEYDSLIAFLLKLDYNSDILEFQGINAPAVDGITVDENNNEIQLQWDGVAQDFTEQDIITLQFILTQNTTTSINFLPGSYTEGATEGLLANEFINSNITSIIPQDTLAIQEGTMFENQTVIIPVTTTALQNIEDINLTIVYNDQLTFEEWEPEQLTGWEFTHNGNEIVFSWSDENAASLSEGNLLYLEFVYYGDSYAPISFADESIITDDNGMEIVTAFENGGVNAASGNAEAMIAEVINCDNNQALVPVTVSETPPTNAMELEIGYNLNGVEFVELQDVHPMLEGYAFTTENDVLSFSWSGDGDPVDINGVLFNMLFNYLGNYSAVTFNTGSEILDNTGQSLPVLLTDGFVDCSEGQQTLIINNNGNGDTEVREEGTLLDADDGTENQYTVLYGTTLTLEAFAGEGWGFVSWAGEVNDTESNPTTIVMDANYTVAANFDMIDYSLTLNNIPEEGGSSSGEGLYNYGEDVTAIAHPNEGWHFESWTDDGGNIVSGDPLFEFPMPAEELLLNAHFAVNEYNLSLEPNPAEGGTVEGDGVYPFEASVTAEAISAEGWSFTECTNNGEFLSEEPVYNFPMPAENLDLIAHFEFDVAISNHLVNPKLSVFPNPAKDNLTINTHDLQIENISLYNRKGRLVKGFHGKHFGHKVTIRIPVLPAGIYYLKIKTDKATFTEKVLLF
jgi:hypothetical protein